MTGRELAAIRHRLGLSTTGLGRAFGYTGSDVTASGTIRKYESDARPIPPWLGRLAMMFDRFGVPDGWSEFSAPEPVEPAVEEPKPESPSKRGRRILGGLE